MMDVGEGIDRRPRGGFTIVEVIIAVIVLAVGILGMATTTAYVVRQVTLADATSKRAVAFATAIEQARAAGFDSLSLGSAATGSDSVGPFAVSWSSALDGSRSVVVTVITVGPGLVSVSGRAPFMTASATDTFTYRVIRP